MTDSLADLLNLAPSDPKAIYDKSILKDVTHLDEDFSSAVAEVENTLKQNLNSITTFIEKDKPAPTFDLSTIFPETSKSEIKVDLSPLEVDLDRPNKNLKKRQIKSESTIKPCTASNGKQVDGGNSLTLQQIIDQAEENSVISIVRKTYNEEVKIHKKITLKIQPGFGKASVTSVSLFADCRFVEISFSGFSSYGKSSSVFENCSFSSFKGDSFLLSDSSSLLIENCKLQDSCISLRGRSKLKISNSSIERSPLSGILITETAKCWSNNNRFCSNFQSAVCLQDSGCFGSVSDTFEANSKFTINVMTNSELFFKGSSFASGNNSAFIGINENAKVSIENSEFKNINFPSILARASSTVFSSGSKYIDNPNSHSIKVEEKAIVSSTKDIFSGISNAAIFVSEEGIFRGNEITFTNCDGNGVSTDGGIVEIQNSLLTNCRCLALYFKNTKRSKIEHSEIGYLHIENSSGIQIDSCQFKTIGKGICNFKNSTSIEITKSSFTDFPVKMEKVEVKFSESKWSKSDKVVCDIISSTPTFVDCHFLESVQTLNCTKQSNITLQNCIFQDVRNTGILLMMSEATLQGTKFNNVSIPLTSSKGQVNIENCEFIKGGKVELELNSTICKVSNSLFDETIEGPSISGSAKTDITLTHCTISRSKTSHVEIRGASKLLVSSCTLSSSVKGAGIQFTGADVTIEDSSLSGESQAAVIGSSGKLTVKNSKIFNNVQSGLRLTRVEEVLVENCDFDNNGPFGISGNMKSLVLKNSKFHGHTQCSVSIPKTSKLIEEGNTFDEAQQPYIQLGF